ncbi:MAG: hypothetical protein RQ801_05240, partial [Spirochaetaceae bacterium]|nr:hypothetical protein [Spirochaetaceae bacterium]
MNQLKTTFLVRFSVEHPWIVILSAALITVLSVFPLTHLSVEADVESLLPAAETDEPISETNIDQVRYD